MAGDGDTCSKLCHPRGFHFFIFFFVLGTAVIIANAQRIINLKSLVKVYCLHGKGESMVYKIQSFNYMHHVFVFDRFHIWTN